VQLWEPSIQSLKYNTTVKRKGMLRVEWMSCQVWLVSEPYLEPGSSFIESSLNFLVEKFSTCQFWVKYKYCPYFHPMRVFIYSRTSILKCSILDDFSRVESRFNPLLKKRDLPKRFTMKISLLLPCEITTLYLQ